MKVEVGDKVRISKNALITCPNADYKPYIQKNIGRSLMVRRIESRDDGTWYFLKLTPYVNRWLKYNQLEKKFVYGNGRGIFITLGSM